MKYIKNRKQFFKIDKVTEAFQNDLAWGDSLLGRLVNSFIRKGKIAYKTTHVDSLVSAVKTQLDGFIGPYLPEEVKKKVDVIAAKASLEEIDIIVTQSEGKEQEAVRALVGESDEGGLITETIEMIKKTDIPEKDDIEKKLNEFKSKISKEIHIEPEKVNTEEKGEDKLLTIRLSKLLHGKNILSVPIPSDGPFEKMLKSDYTLMNSDIILVNLLKMLRDQNFSKYISEKDKNLYAAINAIKNAPASGLDKAPAAISKNVNNPEKKVAGTVKAHESFIFEGVVQDRIKVLIKNYGKFISKDLNEYLKSVSGNVATENKNRLKSILMNGVKLEIPKESRIEFKIEPNDTLKSVSYAMASLPDSGVNVESLRNKIKELGDNVKVGDNLKRRFDYFYKKLVGANGIELKNEGFIKKYSEFLIREEAETGEPTTEPPIEKKKDETTETVNKIENAKDEAKTGSQKLKEIFSSLFSKEFIQKFEPNKEEAANISKEISDEKIEVDTNKKGQIDPIIKIVNIFGDAYKLYATPVIPSGREGGKVSNKTFREYVYLGGHSSGSPDSPGYGPWAVKTIYDKWRDGVMKIIEDPKYKEFLKNVSINGKQEDGNILMKFMADMLNSKGNYDDARTELLKKYFNITDEEDYGIRKVRSGDLREKRANKEDIDEKQAIWARETDFKNFEENLHTFILINGVQKQEEKELEFNFCMYLYKYDKKLIVKFQENSQEIADQYLKESGLKIEEKLKAKEAKAKVYVGTIGDRTKISIGDTIDIKYVDVAIDTNNPKSEDVKNRNLRIRKIYTLSKYDQNGRLTNVTVDKVESRPKADKEINSAKYYEIL